MTYAYLLYPFIDVDAKRRNGIVETLNDKFAFFINNFDIKVTYSKIVAWKPYKLLSCFVYDWSYAPLKRRELKNALTPVVETKKLKDKAPKTEDDCFKHKSHRAFIDNLRLARKTAIKKNKKVEVLWRGYRSYVGPSDPEFSNSELRRRLLVALREIMKIHKLSSLPKSEEKVSIFFNDI